MIWTIVLGSPSDAQIDRDSWMSPLSSQLLLVTPPGTVLRREGHCSVTVVREPDQGAASIPPEPHRQAVYVASASVHTPHQHSTTVQRESWCHWPTTAPQRHRVLIQASIVATLKISQFELTLFEEGTRIVCRVSNVYRVYTSNGLERPLKTYTHKTHTR